MKNDTVAAPDIGACLLIPPFLRTTARRCSLRRRRMRSGSTSSAGIGFDLYLTAPSQNDSCSSRRLRAHDPGFEPLLHVRGAIANELTDLEVWRTLIAVTPGGRGLRLNVKRLS